LSETADDNVHFDESWMFIGGGDDDDRIKDEERDRSCCGAVKAQEAGTMESRAPNTNGE
jgi:hypothetical protein